MRIRDYKIPVNIVTGFLGAGKTTLLNKILEEKSNENIVVIINEFGELSVDHQLIVTTKEKIIEINSGCICCNVRKDLIDTLNTIIRKQKGHARPIDRVIIETTGMANPAPVIQTFLMDIEMSRSFKIDSVCAVLDAKHLFQHIEEDELQQQIAFADVLLFNKTDLVSEHTVKELERKVGEINPHAKRFCTVNSQLDFTRIIGLHSFELSNLLTIQPDLLNNIAYHSHNQKVNSIVFQDDRPLDLQKLNNWLAYLVQIKGESLYRYKGILFIKGIEERVVFQGVHMLFASTKDRLWKQEEKKCNEIVFIGKDLDFSELEEGFNYCLV